MTCAALTHIHIEYETFGDPTSPAILLIAGNGAQLLFWDRGFCEMLTASGFFVVRFDNRDCGLSTKFDDWSPSNIMSAIRLFSEGKAVTAPYTLDDMAEDVADLLDALAIAKAHICGASMGGMIAQVFAYRHPERTLSLVSIMSNTGNPSAKPGKAEAIAALVAPAPEERDAYIDHQMNIWRPISSPGYPMDENRARRYLAESYDRAFCPAGMARQNLALLATGDRRRALSTIHAPTLIVHGADDPLIPVESGIETARIIPGAELNIIDGMAHELPPETWQTLAREIIKNALRTTSYEEKNV
ncbi:alpha/beta fold hydrolase [Citrobacter youngae]|uniref:alpha/beta fold hydrolase n=1 Tax=Citrobacter youngae TaxID=133448 RepID=UPI00287CD077|nr:alpha/beta hydrolase [Citrobacter youngae]